MDINNDSRSFPPFNLVVVLLIIGFLGLLTIASINYFPNMPEKKELTSYKITMDMINGKTVEGLYKLPKDVTIFIDTDDGAYSAYYYDVCGSILPKKCRKKLKTGVVNISLIERP